LQKLQKISPFFRVPRISIFPAEYSEKTPDHSKFIRPLSKEEGEVESWGKVKIIQFNVEFLEGVRDLK